MLCGFKIVHKYITDLVDMGVKYFSKLPLCWFIDELPSYVRFILAAILISAMLYHTASRERVSIQQQRYGKIKRNNVSAAGMYPGTHLKPPM